MSAPGTLFCNRASALGKVGGQSVRGEGRFGSGGSGLRSRFGGGGR